MNDMMTKASLPASPPSPATSRTPDYTGILPSQKIKEMLNNGEIKTAAIKALDVLYTSISVRYLAPYFCSG